MQTMLSIIMCWHLYQRFEERKGSSSIGNHIKEQHGTVPSDIHVYCDFKILRKCQLSKFDYLIYEMLFIKELKPTLNKQSDSIRVKLFI